MLCLKPRLILLHIILPQLSMKYAYYIVRKYAVIIVMFRIVHFESVVLAIAVQCASHPEHLIVQRDRSCQQS